MKWWKGLFGRERDGPPAGERKSVIVSGVPSFHDGDNFRRNMVTVQQLNDASASVAGSALGLSATFACTICGIPSRASW